MIEAGALTKKFQHAVQTLALQPEYNEDGTFNFENTLKNTDTELRVLHDTLTPYTSTLKQGTDLHFELKAIQRI